METATARRKQDFVPAKKSAHSAEKHVSVPAIEANEEMDPKNLPPKPPKVETALPRKSLSRNVTSYSETGTGISNGNRGCQSKGKVHQKNTIIL